MYKRFDCLPLSLLEVVCFHGMARSLLPAGVCTRQAGVWLAGAVPLFILSLSVGCRPRAAKLPSAIVSTPDDVTMSEERIQELAGPINAFCGDCHVPPNASTFAKGNWHEEVRRGFDFYVDSGRDDLIAPDFQDTVDYYTVLAPRELKLPAPDEACDSSPIQFRQQTLKIEKDKPGISHLLAHEDHLYSCDMSQGYIRRIDFDGQHASLRVVAREQHPAHVEVVQLVPDGPQGLLISELGSQAAEDHDKGRLVFQALSDNNVTETQHASTNPADSVNQSKADDSSSRTELLTGIGRVADARTADFDGDGLPDIVVAEFGWHDTGALHLMLNQSDQQALSFERTVIDARHGASHVFCHDIDEDQDMDLIVLHSQEYETVSAYLNDGTGSFERHTLFAADLPDYGCSSIDLADIDNDGDIDVVLSNGDSMDTFLLKPHHGVAWLENTGELRFIHHRVGSLPGAYGATAGDLDADGDMDIVACSMTWSNDALNTVAWFEQREDGEFVRHCLDYTNEQHACLELGDFDNDGDLDIATGEFEQFVLFDNCGSIWWNEGPKSAKAD